MKRKRMKNTIVTVVGLSLLIVGFLLSPSPYTIIIAMPIFLLGLIVIWSTNQSTIFKLLCTILPIILFVPYTKLVFKIHKERKGSETKIDLVIKENFVGKIFIVNNLDCPVQHETDKRTRIVVPENGVTHYTASPVINHIFTNIIRDKKNGVEHIKWFDIPEGEVGVLSYGSSGVEVDGESYKLNIVEIDSNLSLEIDITPEEERQIIQYIKQCKREVE